MTLALPRPERRKKVIQCEDNNKKNDGRLKISPSSDLTVERFEKKNSIIKREKENGATKKFLSFCMQQKGKRREDEKTEEEERKRKKETLLGEAGIRREKENIHVKRTLAPSYWLDCTNTHTRCPVSLARLHHAPTRVSARIGDYF